MIIIFNDDLTVKEKREASGVAHVRVEHDGQVGYAEIGPGDPRYEGAVAAELTMQGATAIALDARLSELLDLLSTDKFTEYQRRDIISVVRNLPPDEALSMAATVMDIANTHGTA